MGASIEKIENGLNLNINASRQIKSFYITTYFNLCDRYNFLFNTRFV